MPLNIDSQGVLDKHSRSGTHHGTLSKDILLLIPLWCQGKVVGEQPEISPGPDSATGRSCPDSLLYPWVGLVEDWDGEGHVV